MFNEYANIYQTVVPKPAMFRTMPEAPMLDLNCINLQGCFLTNTNKKMALQKNIQYVGVKRCAELKIKNILKMQMSLLL